MTTTPKTTKTAGERIAMALLDTLISPNEADRNMEAANVVDGLFAIARALHDIADAIRETGNDKQPDRVK